jgi:putative transposase
VAWNRTRLWYAQSLSWDFETVEEAGSLQSSRVEAFAKPVNSSVRTIVRTFKAAVTREARHAIGESGAEIWQRDYFERVIRNGKEYSDTYRYILENPIRWRLDRENPAFNG